MPRRAAVLVAGLGLAIGLLACGADVRLGVVARPDAGVLDVPDAAPAPDAEVDAGSIDAGFDAGEPDSGPPPPPPPPPPLPADGAYQIAFVPGPAIECEGSLVDIEPRFVDMLPEQVDLHDGEIEVKRTGSVLEVWGLPIELGYGVDRIALQETEVQGIFLGWTERFGLGPDGTREDLARLRMDVEVPNPLPPETIAQIRYVDGDDGGECLVSFRAVLIRK